MSCPPTHFRRSLTSPSVLKSAATRSPAEEEERARVDLGRGRFTRNSGREDGREGSERGRRLAREELQRGRRSVTAGPLGGNAVRARGAGSRRRSAAAAPDEQAHERWTLEVARGASVDGSPRADPAISSRDELVGAAVDPLLLLPSDLGAAFLSLAPPPFPSFLPHNCSSSNSRPLPSSRHSPVHPSAPTYPSLLQPLDFPSSRARTCAAPSRVDAAIETLDSDWSPLFSPEHCTTLHVSLHGAGGDALPSPSSSISATSPQPRRLSYDVPDEYDAWEAATRCNIGDEARPDETGAGGAGRGTSAGGRTAAARRRLEMVRVQLAG
ncbi:hypothetical protein JCM3775_000497 [Rhodotorula graminis]